MRRRQFLTLLGGAAATWPLTARAQQHERVRRVVVWFGRAEDAEGQRWGTAYRQGLQALGWTDGRNLRTAYRWEGGDSDRRQTIAKESVEQRPDGIVAASTVAVAALARESRPLPMVCVNIADPIGSGFVASLAHPGGTITGFLSNEPTLGSTWPELLKEIAPGIGRMGFLFHPDMAPYADAFWQQAAPAARALGVALIPPRVHNDAEIERAITVLGSEPGSGLIVLPDLTTNARSELIVGLTARYHLPAIYAFRFHAIGGGLLSYGVDGADVFRDATRRGRCTGKRESDWHFPRIPRVYRQRTLREPGKRNSRR